MPYKNKQDRLDNQKLWYNYGKQLPKYRAMGLEPQDINDVRSPLQCEFCGKVTPRNCAHVFRHELDCVWRPITMNLLGYPRTNWSRKKGGDKDKQLATPSLFEGA